MAPNGGHLLVGKTMRLIKFAVDKASKVLRDKLPQAAQPLEAHAEPVYVRISNKQGLDRIQAIRQSQSRFYSTNRNIDSTVRHFSSTAQQGSKPSRASFPSSRTGQRVAQLTSRAPFASTLRPNLTGGTLSRSAGGYTTGAGRVGGRRYFSHTPASAVEVIQNVSQAVRAFWLSGQKAHFDGYDPKTGEKRFRAVSSLQDKARHNLDTSRANAAGSFVDFKVSPTITAIGPLSSVPRFTSASTSECDSFTPVQTCETLTDSTIISTLEVDFARALKDLAAIMNDLKQLSTLGSLPLMLLDQTTLRVRFPGCDKDTVENLCRELNIRRGMVGQDQDFDERCGADMALMFPFAPSRTPSDTFDFNVVFENENERPTKRPKRQIKRSRRDNVDWQAMMSPSQTVSPGYSPHSATSHDILEDVEMVENPWLSSPSGYSSLHISEVGDEDVDMAAMFFQPAKHSKQYVTNSAHTRSQATGYEGLEGVYRFIEECDRAQMRR